MKTLTLSDGQIIKVECLSCALTSGMIKPQGGVIYETPHFHAHQDVAYPIQGLVIRASKRHFKSMDELTEEEQVDYIRTLTKIRKAQRNVLGIEAVYYFYNEDTTHHFHTWMVPRYDWMKEFGHSVESLRPVLLHARNSMNDEQDISQVIKAIEKLKMNLNE